VQTMFGERGVLAHFGDKVQCHICGKTFRGLSNHVPQAHGMTAGEYRAEFGLPRTLGLVSDELHRKRSDSSHLNKIQPRKYEPVDLVHASCAVCNAPLAHRMPQEWSARQVICRSKACHGEVTRRFCLGRKFGDETRKRYSEIAKRRGAPTQLFTPEAISKRAEKQRGKTLPEWIRARMRGERVQRVEKTCTACGAVFRCLPSSKQKTCLSAACKFHNPHKATSSPAGRLPRSPQ
jgi:hypothetical protein